MAGAERGTAVMHEGVRGGREAEVKVVQDMCGDSETVVRCAVQ